MFIIIVEPNQEMKYKEKFSKKYYVKKEFFHSLLIFKSHPFSDAHFFKYSLPA